MLRISRMADYAARVVMHLATGGSNVTIAEIAQAKALPVPFVRRLVAPLIKAQLVVSVRGQKGGLSLARPASEISLFDVVCAIDGPIALNLCQEEEHSCPFSPGCPIQQAWIDASHTLKQALLAQTFDRLGRSRPEHANLHVQLGRKPVAPREE